ncbi:hypothetical protein EMN47_10320 [Prolixibacteraceae bacterium JC049]|nr:hypothetical protein [Prolixibacteraceae bacterium JC049]
MKNIVLLVWFALLVTNGLNLKAQNTAVYASPHPDDWQLFYNPNISSSILNDKDTVIILHTTAGDAGAAMGRNNYALAREEGSLRGMRFIVNSSRTSEFESPSVENITVNNHSIRIVRYKNAIAVFLRLPDGGGGGGYESTGHQSLQRFYRGEISTITAVDNSTTYSSLDDLKTTIQQLIVRYSQKAKKVGINVPDTDTSINPGDHRDHRHTSLIMQELASGIANAEVRLYQMYVTRNRAANLSGNDYYINAGTWAATTSGLGDMFHSTTWDNTHNSWVDKQYFRMKSSTNTSKAAAVEPVLNLEKTKLLANEVLNVAIEELTDKLELTIFTIDGAIFYSKEIDAQKGTVEVEIPLNDLKPGNYSLIARYNKHYFTYPFTITQ